MVGCIVNSFTLLHSTFHHIKLSNYKLFCEILAYKQCTKYLGRKLHTTRNPVTGQHISETPEPEGSKGKGNRHSEGSINAKKRTPIATQRNRKPQNSASILGKPALTTCTVKITIINPVVTSKIKFPKSADKKIEQGTVKETLTSKGTNQRTEKACPEPEDLEEDTLDIGGWQDTEGNHTHPSIHFPIQLEPQTRGLEIYGSSSSASPTPEISILTKHGQQE
ncbi:hypothetical protein O181_051019, partial [Austropuccinia psidii MF-1]|nr:hypothetical protein [Austropuccinia psidii MF-1]